VPHSDLPASGSKSLFSNFKLNALQEARRSVTTLISQVHDITDCRRKLEKARLETWVRWGMIKNA
jgi:acetolactate synthase regulatory subunit